MENYMKLAGEKYVHIQYDDSVQMNTDDMRMNEEYLFELMMKRSCRQRDRMSIDQMPLWFENKI